MSNTEKPLNRRKIAIFAVGIIAVAVCLCLIIPVGIRAYPFLVIIGFVSFSIMLFIVILMAFTFAIISTWRFIKLDFGLWKKTFNPSLETRYEASKSLRELAHQDPVLRKTGKLLNKMGLWCFFTWLILFVLTVCVVLFLDCIGVWKNLVD
jgi:hypothetical protein